MTAASARIQDAGHDRGGHRPLRRNGALGCSEFGGRCNRRLGDAHRSARRRGIFFGVSCPGAGECTAVGLDASQPTAATETGGVWGTGTEVPGSISGGAEFSAVSCTGAGECTAVGNDNDNNVTDSRAIAATESGGVWGTSSEVSASSGAVDFSGVSCTGAGECTAVGDDSDRQPIAATESGGTWGTATEVPSPLGPVDFHGVSCTDAVDCTAVGVDMAGQAIYATELVGTWGTVTVGARRWLLLRRELLRGRGLHRRRQRQEAASMPPSPGVSGAR